MLDLGYNLEDIIKVNIVYSKAAVINFLALDQEIRNNLTELREPLHTNMAT